MTYCSCDTKPYNTGSHVSQQQELPIKEYLSNEFKQWFQNPGSTVSKATVRIVPNVSLYEQFGGSDNKRIIVVNASNEHISFGGGGLNGALSNHVNTHYCHKKWVGLRLPSTLPGTWDSGSLDISIEPGWRAKVGEYVISDVGPLLDHNEMTPMMVNPSLKIGEIYHAIGPRASETIALSTAQDQVKTLYYNILKRATHHVGYLVLPAISTEIFADTDYSKRSFTKNEFIATMYEGMYQGIQEYQCDTPASLRRTCHVILNNWEPLQ
jgi:O-acetyl-ADP-ribose deacetylase (regulator of RNase III)